MREDYDIVDVTSVARSRLGYHCIAAYYNESDPHNAVGAVLLSDKPYGSQVKGPPETRRKPIPVGSSSTSLLLKVSEPAPSA